MDGAVGTVKPQFYENAGKQRTEAAVNPERSGFFGLDALDV